MMKHVAERNCPVCDSIDRSSLDWLIEDGQKYKSPTTHIGPEVVAECVLSLCNFCKCVYFSRYPTILEAMYIKDYRNPEDFTAAARINENNAKCMLFYNNIRRYLTPGCKILDVGCSEGFFIKYLNDLGFDAKGVELNGLSVDFARERGLEVFDKDVLHYFPDERFDFIFTSGYIEHVIDPKRILTHMRENLLTKQGYVYMGTPDVFNPNRHKLSEFFPPEHVQMFSQKSLCQLLRVSGFDEVGSRGDVYNLGQAMIGRVSDKVGLEAEYNNEDVAALLGRIKSAHDNNRVETDMAKISYWNVSEKKDWCKGDCNILKEHKAKHLLSTCDIDIVYKLYRLLKKSFEEGPVKDVK